MNQENLKKAAKRLSTLVSDEHGSKILSSLGELSHSSRLVDTAATEATPELIQIGQWRKNGDSFERVPSQAQTQDLWADVERFPIRSTRKRSILLGESVARGFFYDPTFTPAGALENILNGASGENVWEVLDLARTDLTLDMLSNLLDSVHLLNPDSLVIFAGNNWNFHLSQVPRITLNELLNETSNLPDFLKNCQSYLPDLVVEFCLKLSSLRNRLKIPVVFIIPEFNLGDWHCPADEKLVSWLRDDKNARWIDLRGKAELALSQKKLPTVKKLALEMLSLDEGCSPVGFEFLAQIAILQKNFKAAKGFYQQARDAVVVDTQTPRCSRLIAETLRSSFKNDNLDYVDLTEVFFLETQELIPGKNIFLDYCHLNSFGTALAMASAARKILGSKKTVKELQKFVHLPDPRTESVAYFLAAIHNSHWGQGDDTVEYLLTKSRDLDPIGREVAGLFLDYKARQIPDDTCASYQKMLLLSPQFKARYVAPIKNLKLQDVQMMKILLRLYPEQSSEIHHLRSLSFGISGGSKELAQLSNYHGTYSSLESWTALKKDRFAFTSFNPSTKFHFYCEEPKSLQGNLAFRLVNKSVDKKLLKVYLNGHILSNYKVKENWVGVKLKIPSNLVYAGINILQIEWPKQKFNGDVELENLKSQIELDRPLIYHPIFGQVSSLTINSKEMN